MQSPSTQPMQENRQQRIEQFAGRQWLPTAH